MIYFDKELCEKAYKLLESTKDLKDTKEDIEKIDHILFDFNRGAALNYDYLQHYDQELNRKYEEITIINSLANSLKWKKDSDYVYDKINCPRVIRDLDNCRYCILAHVLKKAGEIKEYIEFFDKGKIIH